MEDNVTEIEVTGAKATLGFFETAIDLIGEQFTNDSNTLQVRQNAQKGEALKIEWGKMLKNREIQASRNKLR